MTRRWKDPDKRMAAAVRYRAGGLSLREIGDRLGVSKDTIMRDLRLYETAQVEALLSQMGVSLMLSGSPNETGNETP